MIRLNIINGDKIVNVPLNVASTDHVRATQSAHGYLVGTTKQLNYVPRDMAWYVDSDDENVPIDITGMFGEPLDIEDVRVLVQSLREGIDAKTFKRDKAAKALHNRFRTKLREMEKAERDKKEEKKDTRA